MFTGTFFLKFVKEYTPESSISAWETTYVYKYL